MDNERDEHERRAEQGAATAGAATAECEPDQRADTVWSLFTHANVKSAPDETHQGAYPMSSPSSKQSALTHTQDDFYWNETADSRSDDGTGCGDALSKALGSQADDADHRRTVETEPNTSLRKRCASQKRRSHSAAPQPEKKTETASRRLWTLSNETARHRQLLAARMSSKAAGRGRNQLHLGVVGHLTWEDRSRPTQESTPHVNLQT